MKDLRPSNGDVFDVGQRRLEVRNSEIGGGKDRAHAAPRVVVGAGLQDVLLPPALAGRLVALAEAGVAEEEQVEARAGAARARRQDDTVGRGQLRNGSGDSDGFARSRREFAWIRRGRDERRLRDAGASRRAAVAVRWVLHAFEHLPQTHDIISPAAIG